MTMGFTDESSKNGAEPTELLKALAFEYLVELSRAGVIEFLETVGTDGNPVLLAVIPNVRLEDGRIVEIVGSVGTPLAEENKDE